MIQIRPLGGSWRIPSARSRWSGGYTPGWWRCWSGPATPVRAVMMPRSEADGLRNYAAECGGDVLLDAGLPRVGLQDGPDPLAGQAFAPVVNE